MYFLTQTLLAVVYAIVREELKPKISEVQSSISPQSKKMESKEVKTVYQHDPLADFLFNKSSLKSSMKSFHFALISVVLMALFYIVVASVSGTLTTEADTDLAVLSKDWIAWFWIIILNPIVIGYYPWLSTKNIVKDFFDYLVENKVMRKSNEDDLEIDKELKIYEDKNSLLNFIVLGVTFWYGIVFFNSKKELSCHWASTALFPKIATTIVAMLVMYMILREAVILIINFRAIRKIISNNKFQINPWFPDKCGGLKPVADYIIKVNYLTGTILAMILSTVLQFYHDGVLKDFSYMLVTVPIFILVYSYCIFWTLHAIHTKMEKSRIDYLNNFAKKLYTSCENLSTHYISRQSIKEFSELESSYKSTINTFPVWPFDIKSIQTWIPLIIPIIIPIILEVLKLLQNFIST